MMGVVVCLLVLMASATVSSDMRQTKAATTDKHPLYSITKPLCDPTDNQTVCKMKKSQCSFVTKALSPAGGFIKAYIQCAKDNATPLDPVFYDSIGDSYKTGTPEGLGDLTSADPKVMITIRKCGMNATGLVFSDMTVNRAAAADALVVASGGSPLGMTVAAAAAFCQEPQDFKFAEYIGCLKDVCIKNLDLPTPPPPPPTVPSNFAGDDLIELTN